VRTRSRKTPANVVDLETVQIQTEGDQEADLLDTERRQKVVDGLQILNQRSRLAVILRYFRDMSIREISAVLGCSEGVTRNLLFRSVRKLREAVATE
jgi:RNA polymerase sigma factor (sigma-70 family)